MNEVQLRFKIPNRKKVADLVWELYITEKSKIKCAISDQRVSITTDTWTSIQNINYTVITAHFLDNDWKLLKRVINFTKITSQRKRYWESFRVVLKRMGNRENFYYNS